MEFDLTRPGHPAKSVVAVVGYCIMCACVVLDVFVRPLLACIAVNARISQGGLFFCITMQYGSASLFVESMALQQLVHAASRNACRIGPAGVSSYIYMPNNSSIPQIQTGVPSAHTASSSGTTPCSPAVVPQPAKRRKKKREHVLGDESSALVPQPPQKRPRIETCQNNAGSVVPFGEYELQHQ